MKSLLFVALLVAVHVAAQATNEEDALDAFESHRIHVRQMPTDDEDFVEGEIMMLSNSTLL